MQRCMCNVACATLHVQYVFAPVCASLRQGSLPKIESFIELPGHASDTPKHHPPSTTMASFKADKLPVIPDDGLSCRMEAQATSLWTAASLGRPEEVELLLRGGAHLEKTEGRYESTPLLAALMKGHVRGSRHAEAAITLLRHGANASATDINGRTPLHFSSRGWGHNTVSRVLLRFGSFLSAKDQYGHTPLHIAMIQANVEGVKLLLAKGADVTIRDNRGMDPLFHAVFGWDDLRHFKVAQLLHARGADIHSNDDLMKTPLMAAASLGKPHFLQWLIKKGAVVTAEDLASAEVRVRTSRKGPRESRLKKVASLLRSALKKKRALVVKQTRLDKCVAFAMSHHPRLGAESFISTFPPEMVQLILKLV